MEILQNNQVFRIVFLNQTGSFQIFDLFQKTGKYLKPTLRFHIKRRHLVHVERER